MPKLLLNLVLQEASAQVVFVIPDIGARITQSLHQLLAERIVLIVVANKYRQCAGHLATSSTINKSPGVRTTHPSILLRAYSENEPGEMCAVYAKCTE